MERFAIAVPSPQSSECLPCPTTARRSRISGACSPGAGSRPQHRYGQNFLIDLNLHELIVKTAEVGPDDVVLEIGPGAGAMTALMASAGSGGRRRRDRPGDGRPDHRGGRRVAQRPRAATSTPWRAKHTINPEVLDNVRAGLAVSPEKRLKLVANLPYNIATPIVSNLLVHPELCPTRHGGHDPARAGRADARRARRRGLWRTLGPDPGAGRLHDRAHPAADASSGRVPKVDSAVVMIVPRPEAGRDRRPPLVPPGRPPGLPPPPQEPPPRPARPLARPPERPEVDALLESLGLTGLVRAEAMNVEEFLSLAKCAQKSPGRIPRREPS